MDGTHLANSGMDCKIVLADLKIESSRDGKKQGAGDGRGDEELQKEKVMGDHREKGQRLMIVK